ncbi:hypothetical protein QJQ45_005922 [Haematococcus lacustris]|nr:hypothetical protein QJQ45_005922 [Haematococcus lacustris]
MLCALIAAWLWVTTATYLEMAVSTTHSIIGAIMGFGLVYGGSQAIVWDRVTTKFPYREGLTPIVIAWFTSPILSGAVAAFLLTLNRVFILRRANSTLLALIFLPPLVTLTIFINVFFVLYKGARATLAWSDDKAAWVAICVAGGCGLLTIPLVLLLRRRLAIHVNKHGSMHPAQQPEPELARDSRDWQVQDEAGAGWGARLYRRLVHSLTVDVHEDLHKDEAVAAMHSAAEVFDPRTEEVYKYLQVFSACCVSFAHGANDVANAVGPFSAIWAVYNTRHISSTAATPIWVLALGGAGLVTGLATYGYNIIKVLT